jgi:hypothetical protein
MRILELESRCAVIRTVGSNPTLSAKHFDWLESFLSVPHGNPRSVQERGVGANVQRNLIDALTAADTCPKPSSERDASAKI